MKKYFLLLLLIIIGFSSCEIDEQSDKPQIIKKEKISGVIQKGPFVSGTIVTMNELNSELVQTGKVFTSNIINDLGLFEVNNIELNSRFVEFTSSGFYFNEVSGEISNSQINLTSLSDVSDKNSINVNVLTHLEKRRVETLLKEGKSFSESKKQSRNELLSVFSMSLNSNSSFEEFDISQNTEEGGVLLAISIILQGNRSVGQLTELLSQIQNDFGNNGKLDDETIKFILVRTAFDLDFNEIRRNLEKRLKELNKTNLIPDFENQVKKFLDSFAESSDFFIGNNGVTCMCPNSLPGDIGIINGIDYEAVDNDLLRKRITEGADLTKLCTSLVTDMGILFYNKNLTQNIGNWDVSNVIYMRGMFYGSNFNQPIGNWDVSNVTNMDGMFDSSKFNQPIENWDVSKVTIMSGMFQNSDFNQPIGNWDVREVINMAAMFRGSRFNHSLEDWDVSKVENMYAMFQNSPFNQPIGNWDVSSVKSMSDMFTSSVFNQSIENWDIRNVTSMSGMFSSSIFNQSIGNWDVSGVEFMNGMFSGSQFNKPIGNWDVGNVTSMSGMFNGSQFNQYIGDWNVSKVKDMSAMFIYSKFNEPIGNWDVSNVENMRFMFRESKFNQPIGNWNVRNVTDMDWMFLGSNFNQNISNWCVAKIKSEPLFFSENSPLIFENKPIWGTCPD